MMAHPKWASENANVSVICVIFEIMFFFHFNCIAASGIFFLKSLYPLHALYQQSIQIKDILLLKN